MTVLIILCIAIAVVGVSVFILAVFNEEFGICLIGLIFALVFGLLAYSIIISDTNRDERIFQIAMATKHYESAIVEVQGIYKDKIIANEVQYNLNLNYAETKDVTDIKPSTPVKITYIPTKYKGNIIITVEKLK